LSIRRTHPYLKLLTCALGILVLLALVPAISSAATFVVNTTSDSLPPEHGESCHAEPGEECTLREAIDAANADTGTADKITFTALTAGDALQVEENALPTIYGPVAIEGDTAQGATAGVPALLLEPVNFELAQGEPAIIVLAGSGTRIEGLAIGGFGTGIEIGPEEGESPADTEICGDYLGTDLSGEVADPNQTGIEIRRGEEASEWPTGTVIGSGSSTCAGNVISGNNGYGIVDEGVETTIAGNSIGIGSQPAGARLPNGSGGILEGGNATGATIGGVEPEATQKGNLIAFNGGPGVEVESGLSEVSIRHDYFMENVGKGIAIAAEVPPAPSITSDVSEGAGQVTISGVIEPKVAGEEVELEFFGSDDCSREGEGRTFLGVDAIGPISGPTPYSTTLFVEVPAGEHGLTATATGSAGATTEFSACAPFAGTPRTITVNTLGDPEGAECPTTCSLRAAIEEANETEVKDTIEFAVEGKLEPEFAKLPAIEAPVEILGTSAPEYEGTPVIEIDGAKVERGGSTGLVVRPGGGGTTITGLAIGDFNDGILLEGADNQVCGSYLGTESDGATAIPNEVGIETWVGAEGDRIGAGCEMLGGGNLISGNESAGILDRGMETQIAGNRIGISSAEDPLPNGGGGEEPEESAGITIAVEASETTIGPVGLEPGNVVADNDGPGVLVSSGTSKVKVHANSLYGNSGPGIEITTEAPAVPAIAEVTKHVDTVSIKGEATTAAAETVQLQFYASPSCGAGTEGGQSYLGSGEVSAAGGSTPYDIEVGGTIPTGDEYVTATATGSEEGQTSQFSECFLLQPPVGERTFTVNSLGDTSTAALCEEGEECTLRGAIEAADGSEAFDTIDFADSAEGVIKLQSDLPEITEPVEIDGTSAPGYGTEPVVMIDGAEIPRGGEESPLAEGLIVSGEGGGSVIRALAVGEFEYGVYISSADGVRLCSDWVGVGVGGTASPNEIIGVETGSQAAGTQIGVGCGTGAAPNVISANGEWGIADHGRETEIGGNKIGVGPDGAVMPNGGGGIVLTIGEGPESVGAQIGGIGGAIEPNTIAYNEGPGVYVGETSNRALIRANSIYGNEDRGIEYGDGGPTAPTITAVEGGSGALTVSGQVTGQEPEAVELDFYASAVCSPIEAGVGETYLGTVTESVGESPQGYVAELSTPFSDDDAYVTVTGTLTEQHETSEFSTCFLLPSPRTLTVDSLGDAGGGGCTTTCSLREAIEVADETTVADTIDFGVAGTIEPATELPEITEPVEIDGTSAPGYAGSPLIEIGGSEVLNHGGTEGLVIASTAVGTTIKGLAVTGFDNGLVVGGNQTLIEADEFTGNADVGVTVSSTAPRTAIRRTQIYGNGTGSIEFETANSVPEPEVESFTQGQTETGLTVKLDGLPEHEYAVDIYANADCEKPGEHGPMEVFLASGVVTTNAGGHGDQSISGPVLEGIDVEAFTATATDLETGTTSAIGHCTFPPIGTTIETRPPAVSGSSKASFTFTGETIGRVEGFECSLDEAAFSACESPQNYEGLAVGPHTFEVKAYNGEGIRDGSPATYEWTVSTEGPQISITSEPPTKTNSRNARFAFTVSDPNSPVVSVKCKIDGALVASCTSPQEFTLLTAGTHTFELKATDEAGVTNTVTREWRVVTEAASPQITTAPPTTAETTAATFEFGTALGSETSGYECSLDEGAFAPCASPQSFSGLAPGPHTFAVRAKDEAGNTSAPTTYRWTVTAAPAVTPEGPTPINGEKVVVKPEEGKVKIKLPGTKKYVVLTELKEIPVGAVIDATNGRVKLTSISPDGTEQTAEFFGGVFRVKQKEGSGLVVLELLDTTACPAPKKAKGSGKKGKGKKTSPRAAASSVSYRPKTSKTAGKLWGSGHGNFRTEGNAGSATVEGTIWLVEDRCNGTTFFRTRRGIVKVRDFIKHKSLPLPAGNHYLAGQE
jgi:CSLREA domain-containing protein